MSTITDEQKQLILTQIDIAITNLGIAANVAVLLRDYKLMGLDPPSLDISFNGKLGVKQLTGANCGHFTTPVLFMAILETRRALNFFKIQLVKGKPNSKGPVLGAIGVRQNPSDIGCEHFMPVTPTLQEIIATADSVIAGEDSKEKFLYAYKWGNKQLMHYTSEFPEMHFETIVCCCKAVSEIYRVHLYNKLGIELPSYDKTES